MKKSFFTSLVFLTILILYSSCYYDKADQLYPNNSTCDSSATISYSKLLVPLFQQQCYGCHAGTNPIGGTLNRMGTYTADKALALTPKFYGSITHSAGYFAMPEGAPKMTNCQLSIIKKWIDAGAPNN